MKPDLIWNNFFEAGGKGMFPIAISGFLLLASAVVLVLRPERRFVALVVSLGLWTVCSGVVSSVAGIANTLHYVAAIPPDRRVECAAMGIAEALHCTVFALLIVITALILAAVAALRASRAQPAERMERLHEEDA